MNSNGAAVSVAIEIHLSSISFGDTMVPSITD